jgi:galactokinase
MQAVTQTVARSGFVLGGYDALVSSEVPLGAGLASSAALNVAHLRALADAFDWNVDGVEIARMAQRAENDFVGAPVGIMDPMAAMYATARAALFLDTSTLQFESVPLPEAGELAVLDSGGRHWHAEGGYRDRKREYEQAIELLGVDDLRPFLRQSVDEVIHSLPDPLDRRVRHILSENMRVLRVVEALRAGDLIDVGRALCESHESLRKDYEVSTPDLDRLVEAAMQEPQVYGARLTGGGFGGAVLMLTHRGQGTRVAQAVVRRCAEALSNPATILLPIGEIV